MLGTELPMNSVSQELPNSDLVLQIKLQGAPVSQDINVVALVKGEERYIFLFNDEKKSETLRTLGRYASDSKLSFSWYDAAVLSQKVRNIETANPVPASINRRFESPQSSSSDSFSAGDLFSGEDLL